MNPMRTVTPMSAPAAMPWMGRDGRRQAQRVRQQGCAADISRGFHLCLVAISNVRANREKREYLIGGRRFMCAGIRVEGARYARRWRIF